MKEFFYNINSTSWFFTTKKDKVVKFEVFLILMCISVFIGSLGLSHDVMTGQFFSNIYQLSLIPFLLFIAEYTVYYLSKVIVSKEIQDKYWKTQLVRFKNPRYNLQKQQYPNPEEREVLLDSMWESEYDETFAESLANIPWIQRYRIVLLILPAILVGIATAKIVTML